MTDLSGQGQPAQDTVWPAKDSTYAIGSPATAASANTLGSWVQLVANVGVNRILRGAFIMAAANYDMKTEFQFAEGPGGSEAAKEYVTLPGGASGIPIYVPLNYKLSPNVALSVACKDTDITIRTWRVTPVLST